MCILAAVNVDDTENQLVSQVSHTNTDDNHCLIKFEKRPGNGHQITSSGT